VKIDNMVDDC